MATPRKVPAFPFIPARALVRRLNAAQPRGDGEDMSASRAADEVAIAAAVAAARLAGHSERGQRTRERKIRRALGYTYP